MASTKEAQPQARTSDELVAQAPEPYGLQVSEEQLDGLKECLAPWSLHHLVGFLCSAQTIPQPLSPSEWVGLIDNARSRLHELTFDADFVDDDDSASFDDDGVEDFVDDDGDAEDDDDDDEDNEVDDHDAEDVDDLDDDETAAALPSVAARLADLESLAELVRQRVAAGRVADIVPGAEDPAACSDWVAGFDVPVCSTLHEISDKEATLSMTIRAVRRTSARHQQRRSLPTDVAKIISIWREVPTYDPAAEPEAQANPHVPIEPLISAATPGGTFRRDSPKVGRNELCPCGSGRKYKKCCA
jgi:hypothetical protein